MYIDRKYICLIILIIIFPILFCQEEIKTFPRVDNIYFMRNGVDKPVDYYYIGDTVGVKVVAKAPLYC